ncbi:MAG: TetR/AcrR family transcriptional regulator [Gemmatimonadaceae bacterium]
MTGIDEPASDTRTDRVRLRSAARREAERQELREKVLDIARRQLLANGYSRFSVREVAEEAGYTPTALYHYFADRDALLREVTRGYYAQFTARWEAANASATAPRDRLIAMGQAYVRFASDHPAIFRLMFMERPEMGAGATRDRIAEDSNFRLMLQALAELVERGEVVVEDYGQVGVALWSCMHGLAALFITIDLMSLDQLFATARFISETNLDALRPK